jgi:hypothetical protein
MLRVIIEYLRSGSGILITCLPFAQSRKRKQKGFGVQLSVDPLTTCRLKVTNGFAHHFLRRLHCMGTPTFKQTDAELKH